MTQQSLLTTTPLSWCTHVATLVCLAAAACATGVLYERRRTYRGKCGKQLATTTGAAVVAAAAHDSVHGSDLTATCDTRAGARGAAREAVDTNASVIAAPHDATTTDTAATAVADADRPVHHRTLSGGTATHTTASSAGACAAIHYKQHRRHGRKQSSDGSSRKSSSSSSSSDRRHRPRHHHHSRRRRHRLRSRRSSSSSSNNNNNTDGVDDGTSHVNLDRRQQQQQHEQDAVHSTCTRRSRHCRHTAATSASTLHDVGTVMSSPTAAAARSAAAANIAAMSRHVMGATHAASRPLPRPPSTSFTSLSTTVTAMRHARSLSHTSASFVRQQQPQQPSAAAAAMAPSPSSSSLLPLRATRSRRGGDGDGDGDDGSGDDRPDGGGVCRHGTRSNFVLRPSRGAPRAPIYRIVITGGPCSGKSTSMTYLKAELEKLHFAVYCVPEVATLLMTGGVRLWMNDADTRSELARIRAAQAHLRAVRAYERALQTLDEFATTSTPTATTMSPPTPQQPLHGEDGHESVRRHARRVHTYAAAANSNNEMDDLSSNSSSDNDSSRSSRRSSGRGCVRACGITGDVADDEVDNDNNSDDHNDNDAAVNDNTDSPASLFAFKRTIQRVVLQMMMMLEDCFYELAALRGLPSVLLFDRGCMDGSAYCSADEWAAILSDLGCTNAELCEARYDAVVHLVTAAQGAEAHYTLQNNATRRESVAEARAVDAATRRAWREHFLVHIVDNRTDFANKMRRMALFIRKVVGVTACCDDMEDDGDDGDGDDNDNASGNEDKKKKTDEVLSPSPSPWPQHDEADGMQRRATEAGGGNNNNNNNNTDDNSSNTTTTTTTTARGAAPHAHEESLPQAAAAALSSSSVSYSAAAALQQFAYVMTGVRHDSVVASDCVRVSRASSVADATRSPRHRLQCKQWTSPQSQRQQQQRQQHMTPRYAVVSLGRDVSVDGRVVRDVSVSLVHDKDAMTTTTTTTATTATRSTATTPSDLVSSSAARQPTQTPLPPRRSERRHTLPPPVQQANTTTTMTATTASMQTTPASAATVTVANVDDGIVVVAAGAQDDAVGNDDNNNEDDNDAVDNDCVASDTRSPSPPAPQHCACTLGVAETTTAATTTTTEQQQHIVVPVQSWRVGAQSGVQRYFIVTHVDEHALPQDAVRVDVTVLVLRPRNTALRSDVLIRRVHMRTYNSDANNKNNNARQNTSHALYFRRVEYAQPLQQCVRAVLDTDTVDDHDDAEANNNNNNNGSVDAGNKHDDVAATPMRESASRHEPRQQTRQHRSYHEQQQQQRQQQRCYRARSIVTRPINRERFVRLAARYDATQPLIRNTVTRFIVGLHHMSLVTFVQPLELRGVTRLVGDASLTCEDIPAWIQVDTTVSMTNTNVIM